ncbi:MAG TPA: 30S ribosomal protein S3 [Candidatus Levybacteria bacterium]|nr:30S ribosomal protein S3 [Candidatus Levybacteria bacterium]
MGQKVNPIALRMGIHHDFKSVGYYSRKNYAATVLQDIRIREMLFDKLRPASIGDAQILRTLNGVKITIHVVRPGIVIGRGGQGLEELKKIIVRIMQETSKEKVITKIELKVEPIKDPNLNAYLVANNVADQLNRRMPHRRVMKQLSERVMNARAKGVRIILSGRIGGAEIGRRERVQLGKVSLSTIRENIDYAQVPALTKSGYVGVKVWINKE